MISNPRPCVTSGAYYARHKSTSTFHDYYFNNKVQSPAGLKAPYNQVPPGGLDSIRLRRKKTKKNTHIWDHLFSELWAAHKLQFEKKNSITKKKNSISEKMADRSPLAPVCPFVCFLKKIDSTEQKSDTLPSIYCPMTGQMEADKLCSGRSNNKNWITRHQIAPPVVASKRKWRCPLYKLRQMGAFFPPPKKKKIL